MRDAGPGPGTAVIVMAYGSPERPEDIPAYFADIRGGRPVPAERVEELAERYRRIGGSSPLNEITERQRAGLEAELGLPVYTGMKHWRPWIADAAEAARAGGAERLVGLVLAPHYSRLSVGGYRERLEASLNGSVELRFVESWHDHEPFVALVAHRVAEKLDERGWRDDGHVVFTAHSLPQRILSEGDPYREQLLETARLAADPRRPPRRTLVVRLPEREPDGRAVARPGHPRAPRRPPHGRRPPGARRAGRVRRRPPGDPLGPRRRGAAKGR